MRRLPPLHAKVVEERCKLIASGCQTTAIGLTLTVIIASQVSSTMNVSEPVLFATGLGVICLEVAAIMILRYTTRPRLPEADHG